MKWMPLVIFSIISLGSAVSPSQAAEVGWKEAIREPLGCPYYAVSIGGGANPEHMASEITCITGWLIKAREYITKGGAPTQYTNKAKFEEYRTRLKESMARLSKWADEVRIDIAPSASEGFIGGPKIDGIMKHGQDSLKAPDSPK